MLTIFACPKPFTDPHIAIIQRNAITSWTLLRPRPEIILFGDEPGVAEICEQLGLTHVPEVERNEYGTPLLNDIFEKAQRLASYDVLCYANADIILMGDFIRAVQRVTMWRDRFLMVGRRWDVDITKPLSFEQPDWEKQVRSLALNTNRPRSDEWIDYFVFARSLLLEMPGFAIGRCAWDNWLVWRARSLKIPVVDVSSVVIAVHQNHDYSHHPEGEKGVWYGEEAKRNSDLAGGWTHLCTIAAATHRLTVKGIERNLSWGYFHHRLEIFQRWLIDWTRPLRHAIGIRRETLSVLRHIFGAFK